MKKLGIIFIGTILMLTACSKPENNKIGSNELTEKSSEVKKNVSSTSEVANETSVTATKASKTVIAETTTTQEGQSSQQEKTVTKVEEDKTIHRYNEAEKRAITEQFLNWADERAQIGGMAVSSRYYDHGAMGPGNICATTVDGPVLVQRHPLESDVSGGVTDIEGLGGVVFYYSLKGTLGKTQELNPLPLATGMEGFADESKPIVKYLLGDNGQIYEFKSGISFSDGFLEGQSFYISEDQAARDALRNILNQY